MHDDLSSSTDPTSKEYSSKSLWKEDGLLIQRVAEHFHKSFTPDETFVNDFYQNYGTVDWEYAMTLNNKERNHLIVPIIKNGNVEGVMEVKREGKQAFYSTTKDREALAFFQTIIFDKQHTLQPLKNKTLPNPKMEGKGNYVWTCVTKSFSMYYPEASPPHWESTSYSSCKYVYYKNNPYVDHLEFFSDGLDSGGGGDEPEPQDPCEKTEASITNANNVLKNNDVKTKMDALLKGKTQASNEWAVAIRQKPNGYEVTPAVEQNSTSGTVPNSMLTSPYIGDGHSHAGGFGNPSGGDLYGMLNSMITNANLKYRYVYGDYFGTPEVYVLVVDERDLSIGFLANYPMSANYNPSTHSFLDGSSIGTDFFNISDLYGQGTFISEMGDIRGATACLAYILDKYNTGISLAKVDNNGNLRRVNVQKENIVIPGGTGSPKEGLSISNCP